ncbi:MAG: Gfo/Idh/MocA family protein [Chthoniobacterales bacterium]
MRGAIIGFGQVAEHGHLPGYAQTSEVQIVAVVDPAEARRARAQELIPGVATVSTLAELSARLIDFVDICTPPAMHGEAILTALEHGWDVLCEKPLLLDLAEMEQVREAAATSGRAVVPVHNWKYALVVRRATAALRAGAIGELRQIEIETIRTEDCAVADPARPNWRRDPAIAGGGILTDHGWHAIYLALHWFGDVPTEVSAILRRASPATVENEARLTLGFPNGEARIFLTWTGAHRRNAIRFVGEKARMTIDDDVLELGDESIKFVPALSAGSHHPDWFAAMLPDVLASFREPAQARAAFEEAGRCLAILRAAYETASWETTTR